ncbi:MAG: hypothetical protein ACFFD4_22385 [Candidatus Odinarchaeota archaeon]
MPLFGSKTKARVKKTIKKGLILIKEMKYQEAIDLLNEINLEYDELDNKLSCGIWAALGMAYQGLRKYEIALDLFEKCLAVDKKRFEYLYGASICAISLENWEKAQDYYYSLEINFGDMPVVEHLAPYFQNLEQQHKQQEDLTTNK